MGLVIIFLSSCIESIMMFFMPGSQSANETSVHFLIFVALYAAFVSPLFEEIKYRMLLFNDIFKETNKLAVAVGISAIMFLIIHSGDINYGALILGIISAIIFFKTGEIIYSVMMHFSGNLLCSLLILCSLNSNNSETTSEVLSRNDILVSIISDTIFGLFWLIVLIVMLVVAFIRIKNKLSNDNMEFTNKKLESSGLGYQSIILVFVYVVVCGIGWYIHL